MNIVPCRRSPVLWIGCALLIAGCAGGPAVVGPSGTDKKASADSPNALPITDMAVPAGATLDTESSLIIGTGERWLGRVVLKIDISSIQAFNHFYNGLSAFGWSLVTAVQARTSSLTFLRGERVASIQIEPSSLGGSTVSITVSPRQAGNKEPPAPRK